jgi:hypothetical protein
VHFEIVGLENPPPRHIMAASTASCQPINSDRAKELKEEKQSKASKKERNYILVYSLQSLYQSVYRQKSQFHISIFNGGSYKSGVHNDN